MSFLWRKQKGEAGIWAMQLRGLPASENLGPGLLALRVAKPSKGQRIVSGNEWKASDRHAVSCKITNRPGMLSREPNRLWASLTVISHGTACACFTGAGFGIKKKIIICLPPAPRWLIHIPREGLCCCVCVLRLFCSTEESRSRISGCKEGLKNDEGRNLNMQSVWIKGLRDRQAGLIGSKLYSAT